MNVSHERDENELAAGRICVVRFTAIVAFENDCICACIHAADLVSLCVILNNMIHDDLHRKIASSIRSNQEALSFLSALVQYWPLLVLS